MVAMSALLAMVMPAAWDQPAQPAIGGSIYGRIQEIRQRAIERVIDGVGNILGALVGGLAFLVFGWGKIFGRFWCVARHAATSITDMPGIKPAVVTVSVIRLLAYQPCFCY